MIIRHSLLMNDNPPMQQKKIFGIIPSFDRFNQKIIWMAGAERTGQVDRFFFSRIRNNPKFLGRAKVLCYILIGKLLQIYTKNKTRVATLKVNPSGFFELHY